jgi:uncharacterized protein
MKHIGSTPHPILNRWSPDAPGAVPSPCNSVCRIDPASGYCQGCWRTISEITQWAQLDDDAQRALWRELQHRAGEGAAR